MTTSTTHYKPAINQDHFVMDHKETYSQGLLPLNKNKMEKRPVGNLRKISWTTKEKEDSYKEIQSLVQNYAQSNNPEILGDILIRIQPILAKSCRHFFGFVQEDLLQDGYVYAIERIIAYDLTRENVKFLGYMKKMMMFFYWDKKKQELKEKERVIAVEDRVLDKAVEEIGFQEMEIQDALSYLEAKEQKIIQEHVLEKKQLIGLCKEMGISYAYGKELKRKALDRLRFDCKFPVLPKRGKVVKS